MPPRIWGGSAVTASHQRVGLGVGCPVPAPSKSTACSVWQRRPNADRQRKSKCIRGADTFQRRLLPKHKNRPVDDAVFRSAVALSAGKPRPAAACDSPSTLIKKLRRWGCTDDSLPFGLRFSGSPCWRGYEMINARCIQSPHEWLVQQPDDPKGVSSASKRWAPSKHPLSAVPVDRRSE